MSKTPPMSAQEELGFHPPHPARKNDVQNRSGVRVCAKDARSRLQEGYNANGAVNIVPRRDEFSLTSTPQCKEIADASSQTTIVMLVRHPRRQPTPPPRRRWQTPRKTTRAQPLGTSSRESRRCSRRRSLGGRPSRGEATSARIRAASTRNQPPVADPAYWGAEGGESQEGDRSHVGFGPK